MIWGDNYAIRGPSEAISAVGPPWGPHGVLWGVHGAATSRGRGWARMQLPGVDCEQKISNSKHLTDLTTPRDTAVLLLLTHRRTPAAPRGTAEHS